MAISVQPNASAHLANGRGVSWWLPADLAPWVDAATLLRFATAAAQDIALENLRAVFSFSAPRFHHPWRLLAVVTWAHARGYEAAEDIAAAIADDEALLAFCHGAPPAPELLERFRRANALEATRCLEQVFRAAWRHRFGAQWAILPGDALAALHAEARARVFGEEHCAPETDFLKEEKHTDACTRQ